MASVDGVGLWVERYDRLGRGDLETRAPILLLSEAEAPSSRWPARLLERLRTSIGSVIRFDTRDVGSSDWVESGYTLDDLAVDAVSVLDRLGVERAHVVGRSMGGMIGQLLALDHATRVESLTLISTTGGPSDELGSPDQWLVDRMAERLFGPEPRSSAERIEWIVEQQEWFAGPRFEFDRAASARWAAAEAAAAWRGQCGHGLAVVNAPDRYGRLDEIDLATLVVHGTSDPVYPVSHGQALARSIRGAELHLIEGLGHEIPEGFVDQLGDIISEFLAGRPS